MKNNIKTSIVLMLLALFFGNPTGVYAVDTDGDGVEDIRDLDDDNDGVLDTEECPLRFSAFSIKEKERTSFTIPNSTQLMVGDVTGDGVPNIVATANENGIIVLKGDGSDFNDSIIDINITLPIREGHSVMNHPALADFDGDGVAEIAILGKDDFVYIFKNGVGDVASGNYWLKSDKPSNTRPDDAKTVKYQTGAGTVRIADVDEDGISELHVGRSIYKFGANFSTLNLVVDANKSTPVGLGLYHDKRYEYEFSSHIVDIFASNPGKELVVYNKVYDINMTTGRLRELASFPVTDKDGVTNVADVNNDALLDVIITEATSQKMHVWTPDGNLTLLSVTLPGTAREGVGAPTVYNIYNDKQDNHMKDFPEIIVTTSKNLTVYNIQEGNNSLWNLSTTDYSGQTRVTAFDFEGDGIGEIVYRDTSSLRIINGNTKSPEKLASFNGISATWAEGNVIADVDNDGHAEIVSVMGTSLKVGNIGVYTTNDPLQPWRPAPKYWNQLDYRFDNINPDLTIPATEGMSYFVNGQPLGSNSVESCDTDRDGIPDVLDTDSDNDGCYDAIEADGNFTLVNLNGQYRLSGGVDGDGVPHVVGVVGQGLTLMMRDDSNSSSCPTIIPPAPPRGGSGGGGSGGGSISVGSIIVPPTIVEEPVEEEAPAVEEGDEFEVIDNVLPLIPGSSVTIDLLDNDRGAIDPNSAELIIPEGFEPNAILSDDKKTLTVEGEGKWTLDATGRMVFSPEDGFIDKPTDVLYGVKSIDGTKSGIATISLVLVESRELTQVEDSNISLESESIKSYCQESDTVPALSLFGIFIMMFMSGILGLLFTRQEMNSRRKI